MNQAFNKIDDNGLARAAMGGDRAAFDAIVSRYCQPLAEFAAARTPTVQDAEDIVQEAFLRAYLNLQSFDPEYSLKNWLFTITYRLIVSHYRKKKPLRLPENATEEMPSRSRPPGTENEWLWGIIKDLSADDQTVLWMRYKQEMSIPEIAQVMKKSQIGIRVKLHRARNRLIEQIQQSPQDTVDWVPGTICLERTQ